MIPASFYVVAGITALTVLTGWRYFRRFQVNRPPVGVINLGDVALLLTMIVVMPALYLVLPLWVVTAVLAVGMLSALYIGLEPILPRAWLVLIACFALVGADVALALTRGVISEPFLLVNNVVMVIAIVGGTSLWAQSGMKARGVAVLAGALAIYDGVATLRFSIMTDVLNRLSALPLFPVVAWGLDNPRTSLRIGLGDLLLATVFPLVMRKAFGRTAGIVAVATGIVVPVVMLAMVATATGPTTIPVMAVMGPLMVMQYIAWHRARGRERTTWQYLQAEPLTTPAAQPGTVRETAPQM
jgi:hypothetical protein